MGCREGCIMRTEEERKGSGVGVGCPAQVEALQVQDCSRSTGLGNGCSLRGRKTLLLNRVRVGATQTLNCSFPLLANDRFLIQQASKRWERSSSESFKSFYFQAVISPRKHEFRDSLRRDLLVPIGDAESVAGAAPFTCSPRAGGTQEEETPGQLGSGCCESEK